MTRLRVIAAGMAVAVFAVLTAAAPASAHDELVASSPAVDDVLSTAPTEVSLQFSADVLTMGTVVVIADADGVDWAASAPVIDGNSVTVPVLPDMPAAGYELRWRVVSSDGHPISGIIPFTVGDGEPLVRDPAPDATASGAAVEPDSPESQAAQENGALRVVLIGAGGAILAIAALVLVRFLLRRREDPADAGTPDH